MLNYAALYYLLEVSSAQSFTLAAEKLHITRPALSTAIKNLEKDLGFLLLNRNHDGVTLTCQGEIVVQLAQKGFAFFDEIEHLTRNRPDIPAEISVYTTQALTTGILPALVKLYYEQYPEGKFNLYPVEHLSPDEILYNHPDAVVFGIFNESRTFADYVQPIILDKSKSYLAMGKDAPFLPPDVKSISLRELLQIPLITTNVMEEQSFQNDLLAIIRKYAEPNIRFSTTSMGMSTPLVAQNLGATLFISFKALSDVHSYDYRLVSIKHTPKFVLAALYHKDIPQEKLDFFLSLLNQI